MFKSFSSFRAKNAFFIKLCLFFVSSLIILNETEIHQAFLLISLISTFFVLITSLVVFFKEFAHFFFKNFTVYRFVLFIFSCYFFFVTTFYALFLLILQYNLDAGFLDIILMRLSFFEKTIICYLTFVFLIFISDYVKDKNKFSLTQFYQRFLQFLPPIFFSLLLLSFAFLTFSTNFFPVYVLALLIFFPELLVFYKKTWIPQIQNSSFIWHILRFSSGVPIFFFESFFAVDFVLNGKIFISIEKSLIPWHKGAIYASQMQSRTFSQKSLPSPFLFQKFMEVQGRPIRSAEMTKWLADSSKNLVNQGVILPQHGTTSITAGLELHHLYTLLNYQYFEGATFIPTVIPFMNEGFFIVQQKLNAQNLIDLLALSLQNLNFVGLVRSEEVDSWSILRNNKLDSLDPATEELLQAFISHKIKLADWSTLYPETNKLPSYKVDVEDFFAIKNNVERIQTKTEWDGLTGKTFVSENSDVLVNKFSPTENESILLKNGKVIDSFKFSPKNPKFRVFCADLLENKGKLAASKSSADYLSLIKNVIKSTLKNKFTK